MKMILDNQKFQQSASKLVDEVVRLNNYANKRAASFGKQQTQTELIEQCCHDQWQREIEGFNVYSKKQTEQDRKKTHYKNAKHAKAIIERGSRLTRDCDANRDCLNKRTNLTLGSNVTYKIEIKKPLREDYEKQKKKLDPIRKLLEVALCEINDQGSAFRFTELETVQRFLRDGNKLCVCDPDETNRHGVVFIEPCDVRAPDVDNPDVDSETKVYHDWLWEFGIVAKQNAANKRLGYWVYGLADSPWDSQASLSDVEPSKDFGYVFVEDMMHLKNRVDINDPVGIPQSEGTQDWSRALKLLTMKSADSMCCQFDYTVLRTLSDQASTTEKRALSMLEYAKGDKDENCDARPDGPAEHTLKNETIELNAVASPEAAIKLMDKFEHKIGGAWEMPGFFVTGDGGSGNRSNFETMLKPLFASINFHRSMFAGVWSNIVKKIIMRVLKSSQINEIEKYIRVAVSFDPLTVDTALELCQLDALKVEKGFASNQDVIEKNNGDPDEVCRNLQEWKNKNNDQAAALNIDEEPEDDEEDI